MLPPTDNAAGHNGYGDHAGFILVAQPTDLWHYRALDMVRHNSHGCFLSHDSLRRNNHPARLPAHQGTRHLQYDSSSLRTGHSCTHVLAMGSGGHSTKHRTIGTSVLGRSQTFHSPSRHRRCGTALERDAETRQAHAHPRSIHHGEYSCRFHLHLRHQHKHQYSRHRDRCRFLPVVNEHHTAMHRHGLRSHGHRLLSPPLLHH